MNKIKEVYEKWLEVSKGDKLRGISLVAFFVLVASIFVQLQVSRVLEIKKGVPVSGIQAVYAQTNTLDSLDYDKKKENTKNKNDDSTKSELSNEDKYVQVTELSETPENGIYPETSIEVTEQINELIEGIAPQFGMKVWQINIIYQMLKIKPVYIDKAPNIYIDKVVDEIKLPDGVKIQRYLDRNNKGGKGDNHRISDALYSAVYGFDEYQVKNTLRNSNAAEKVGIENLTSEDIKYIKFTADILDYFGMTLYKDKFYEDYGKIVNGAINNTSNTSLLYYNVFQNIEVAAIGQGEIFGRREDKDYLAVLAAVLSGNDRIIINGAFRKMVDAAEVAESTEKWGYEYGKFSRKNMMKAAVSLVGKVRYVWGGGHGGGGQIAGINPMWEKFNDIYHEEAANKCIKPSGSWCPVHGKTQNCAFSGPYVNSLSSYVSKWRDIEEKYADIIEITGDDINELKKAFYNFDGRTYVSWYGAGNNVEEHRVDGLDCSGFASWLYNQVDTTKIYDTTASIWTEQSNVMRLGYGTRLMPGDTVSYDKHIVVIFGRYSENCYIIVEQTPDELKFGACSFLNGSEKLSEAAQYAKEFNKQSGVVDWEDVNSFNFDNYRYGRKLALGRSTRAFEDEGQIIKKYGRSFENLNVAEIIDVLGE